MNTGDGRSPAFIVRTAIAPAGRSAPLPLSVRRHRCHGCCYLIAAGTVRQAVPPTAADTTTHRHHRQQQRCRRPANLIPAPLSLPPLARLPLVVAAAVGSEGIKATTAAVATGRRRRNDTVVGRSPPFPLPGHRRRWLPKRTPAGCSPTSPLPGRRRHCHGCCHLFAVGMVRQLEPATAAATATHRRHRRRQHSRRPLTSLPDLRSPRPLPRLLPSLCSGYGQASGTDDRRYRHDGPPSPPTTATQSSAAHLPPRPPVAAAAATSTATSLQWVWLGKRCRRPPVPAAHPRHRQLQQCQRPLNLISATHPPPPLARLPLVVGAAICSEGMKATTAAATTGRGRRWKRKSSATHLPPRSPAAAAVATPAAIF